ncbi:MAG: PAS domain S-box protein [Gammaproteobacteria bacterium]
MPIIALAERSAIASLESGLRFAPFVGTETFSLAIDNTDSIADAITTNVARRCQRQSYRGALAAAQSHLEAVDPTPPPIRHYLDRLLDQAPIGVINVHSDGTIRDLNRCAVEILGVTPETYTGTSLADYFPLYERSRIRAFCHVFVQTGRSHPTEIFEITFAHKPKRFLEITGSTFIEHMDEIGTTLILQDVTARVTAEAERRRVEAALSKSQQQYRGLVETMTEAVARSNEQHVLTYVNQRFCDMVGADPETVIGRSLLDFVASEHRELVETNMNSLRDREIVRFDNAWSTSHGQYTYTLTSFRRIVDHNGLIEGSLGVFTDISERRRAETALAESEKQLRLITDAVPQLIAYLDSDERFVFTNKAYEEWFHLPRAAINGHRLADIIGNDAYMYSIPHLTRARTGTRVQVECRLTYKGAGTRYVRVNYIPDLDHNKAFRGFFLIVGDLTELKRVEEVERQHLLTLCHASRLMLLGEMSSQISHELAQPIASIATHSNACVRLFESGRVGDTAVRDSLDDIAQQAKRAGDIMTRLRGFVRKELAPSEVDIDTLIDGVLRFADGELQQHGVSVVTHVSEDLPPLSVDRILIEQVLMNLVMNAVEAMHSIPSGQRRLWINADKGDDGDVEHVALSVVDTGPGLSEEARARVFEPFYTTKPQGVGLGLGLVITASIVELHGGRIWLDSELGNGTTVHFTLPYTD